MQHRRAAYTPSGSVFPPLFFFSDDDSVRTRAQDRGTPWPDTVDAASTARAVVLAVDVDAVAANHAAPELREVRRGAARRTLVTSRSADGLKLLASGSVSALHCCRASPRRVSPGYFGHFQPSRESPPVLLRDSFPRSPSVARTPGVSLAMGLVCSTAQVGRRAEITCI